MFADEKHARCSEGRTHEWQYESYSKSVHKILTLAQGKCLHVQKGAEEFDCRGLTGIFAVVFAELAGVGVEGPLLCNLRGNEFYDDVHRFDAGEVICEMRADAERGLAILRSIGLEVYGLVGVQSVAEYDLF